MASKPAAVIIKKTTYFVYLVKATDDGVEQVSFTSETPFNVPEIGAPFQTVGVVGAEFFGDVIQVRHSLEYDQSDQTMVCNMNIFLQ